MNKARILYAEDEPDLRELTSEILTSEGFECLTVKNGEEACQILLSEKFDLLLTDFNMPLLDGADLLFWCRKNGHHLPVVFITGASERLPVHMKALSDSCTSIVNKPFNFRDLIHAIEQSLDRAKLFALHGRINSEETETMFAGQHTLD